MLITDCDCMEKIIIVYFAMASLFMIVLYLSKNLFESMFRKENEEKNRR
jgi:hypothetical protein